jgi:hypothetical protein
MELKEGTTMTKQTNHTTQIDKTDNDAKQNKTPQLNWALVLILIFAATFSMVHMVSAKVGAPEQTYQEQLQSEVDTEAGAPRDGRNPAIQTQTTLAYAASQPAGPGTQVDKPAAAVVGDHDHHVDPTSVLPDTKNTGVLSSGCLLAYGVAGDQCTPVGTPMLNVAPANSATNTSTGTVSSVKPAKANSPIYLQAIQVANSSPWNGTTLKLK